MMSKFKQYGEHGMHSREYPIHPFTACAGQQSLFPVLLGFHLSSRGAHFLSAGIWETDVSCYTSCILLENESEIGLGSDSIYINVNQEWLLD